MKASFLSNLLNPNFDKNEIINNLKEVSVKLAGTRDVPNPDDNYYLFVKIFNNSASTKYVINSTEKIIVDGSNIVIRGKVFQKSKSL